MEEVKDTKKGDHLSMIALRLLFVACALLLFLLERLHSVIVKDAESTL
jgi:hypothetical protein